MKRRNFLKTITGLLAVPVAICSAKSTKKLPQKSSPCDIGSINHDNIKINGTFEEWVDSIAREIERLLAIKSKESDADWFKLDFITKITSNYWTGDPGEELPALEITIYMKDQIPVPRDAALRGFTWEDKKIGSLGFCKSWWDRDHCPKTLWRTLEIMYTDCIWSMYHEGRKQLIFLKKLGMDCSKSLNEYGVI